MVRVAPFLFIAILAGCAEPEVALPQLRIGPEVRCEAPVSGFQRLINDAGAHGIVGTVGTPHNGGGGAMVSAVDMDGDTDVDLMFGSSEVFPVFLENQGGQFVPVTPPHGGGANTQIFLDLDGDDLPEMVRISSYELMIYDNLGGMVFSPRRPFDISGLGVRPGTVSAGDVDGDGDLDLFMSGLEALCDGCEDGPNPGSAQRILRNDGGTFTPWMELYPHGTVAYSIAATFTDRDADGDQDLLLLQDQGANGLTIAPDASFYRNDGMVDGAPLLVDDAPSVGSDVPVSGMGIASFDLDHNGTLDYCLTDTGPIRCLLNLGGVYVDGALALGVSPTSVDDITHWSGWSIEAADIDNDGWTDLMAAGGRPTGAEENLTAHTDVLFQRTGLDTFEDRSVETGFDLEDDHFGLAAADLDGDGAPEVVISPEYGEPVVWWNQCSDGAWTLIDPVGRSSNREAFGARITVEAGGRAWMSEIQSVRALGQSPPVFHVGLGDVAQIDRLTVRWPDGQEDQWTDLPVRRRLEVHAE